jgi:hypothetical protein
MKQKLEITRREALEAFTVLGSAALLTLGAAANAQEAEKPGPPTPTGVAPGKREPVPLPFDPTKLNGLSPTTSTTDRQQASTSMRSLRTSAGMRSSGDMPARYGRRRCCGGASA